MEISQFDPCLVYYWQCLSHVIMIILRRVHGRLWGQPGRAVAGTYQLLSDTRAENISVWIQMFSDLFQIFWMFDNNSEFEAKAIEETMKRISYIIWSIIQRKYWCSHIR